MWYKYTITRRKIKFSDHSFSINGRCVTKKAQCNQPNKPFPRKVIKDYSTLQIQTILPQTEHQTNSIAVCKFL